jgi:hypothetical protein
VADLVLADLAELPEAAQVAQAVAAEKLPDLLLLGAPVRRDKEIMEDRHLHPIEVELVAVVLGQLELTLQVTVMPLLRAAMAATDFLHQLLDLQLHMQVAVVEEGIVILVELVELVEAVVEPILKETPVMELQIPAAVVVGAQVHLEVMTQEEMEDRELLLFLSQPPIIAAFSLGLLLLQLQAEIQFYNLTLLERIKDNI